MEIEPWHIAHARATGHVTEISLEDPGSCLDCYERSPAYRVRDRAFTRRETLNGLVRELVVRKPAGAPSVTIRAGRV